MIGKKFYGYENGKLKIYRVTSLNLHTMELDLYDVLSKTSMHMTAKYMDKHYSPLQADYVTTFCCVKVHGIEDVLVFSALIDDIKLGKETPFIACRQLVSNTSVPTYNGLPVVGNCVLDTEYPKDKFMDMLYCEEEVFRVSVQCYMEDTPLEIFNCIPLSIKHKLNSAMRRMYSSKAKCYGFQSSVMKLLKSNQYWESIDRYLEIVDVPFVVSNMSLSSLQLNILSSIFGGMKDVSIIDYQRDVKLWYMHTDYKLIRDMRKRLYVINYIPFKLLQLESALSDNEVNILLRR